MKGEGAVGVGGAYDEGVCLVFSVGCDAYEVCGAGCCVQAFSVLHICAGCRPVMR